MKVPYTIEQGSEKRFLSIPAKELLKWKFFERNEEDERIPVKFTTVDKQAVALVGDEVLVFRTPKEREFHYEYMLHSNRANWLQMTASPDRVLENMLEYFDII